jgi:G3E family GTPase
MKRRPHMIENIPEFILLTGALGSGKTTLLTDYLSTPASTDTAVIVNEAGEINIDGAVIVNGRRDLRIALMSNGCACCSLGNDLHAAIDEVLEVRGQLGGGDLRRIILEASGLAEPGPIIRSLVAYGRRDFRLRIISTFDALSTEGVAEDLPSRASQLAAAQAVVVTKLDLAGAVDLAAVEWVVREFSPFAQIIWAHTRPERARAAFKPRSPGALPHSGVFDREPAGAHPRIQVLLAKWSGPIAWVDLHGWLEDIAGFCGARLLRVKGLVPVIGSPDPILVDGVGGVFTQPRPVAVNPGSISGIVLIVRDLTLDEIRRFSDSLSTSPQNLRHSGTH